MAMGPIAERIKQFETSVNALHGLNQEIRRAKQDNYLAEIRLLSELTASLFTTSKVLIPSRQEALRTCQSHLEKILEERTKLCIELNKMELGLDKELVSATPGFTETQLAEHARLVRAVPSSPVIEVSAEDERERIHDLLSAVHFGEGHFIAAARLFAADDILGPELAREAGCITYFDVLNMVYPLEVIAAAEGVGGVRHDLQPRVTEALRQKLKEIKEAGDACVSPFDSSANRYLVEQLDVIFNFMFSAKGNKLQLADKAKPAEDCVEIYGPATRELAGKLLATPLSNFLLARRAEAYCNQILKKGIELSDLEEQINGQLIQSYRAQAELLEYTGPKEEKELITAKQLQLSTLQAELRRLEEVKGRILTEYKALMDIMEKHKLPAMHERIAKLREALHDGHRPRFATLGPSITGEHPYFAHLRAKGTDAEAAVAGAGGAGAGATVSPSE